MEWQNRRSRALRRGDYPRLELPARAPRPVRSEAYYMAGPQLSNRSQQRPDTPSGTRSMERAVAQRCGKIREISTFSSLTDHDSDSLSPMLPQQGEQGFVPEQEDVRLPGAVQLSPALFVHGLNSPGCGQAPHHRSGEKLHRPG
jgi:hypothetical protein